MRLKRLGVFLLLSGTTSAFADTDSLEPGAREAVRVYQIQNAALERNLPPDLQQYQPLQERRRPGFVLPDSSGYGIQGEGHGGQRAENMPRQGRLTPEERRALRRQIDEVGHDLYVPKR